MASARTLPRAPSAALAAFVALTVAARLATLVGSSPDADTGGRNRIAAFFNGQGFAHAEVPAMQGIHLYKGEKGFCRIVVGELHLLGWQNDIMAQVAEEGDRPFFIFDGTPYAAPPVWTARMAFYLGRIQRVTGLRQTRPRLFGVLLGPYCGGTAVDWSALTEGPSAAGSPAP